MERLLKQLIPGIAGLLVVVLGAYLMWFSSAKVSHNSGDWGTLGDYFGGLMNPVVSFATLMLAYAVWKQQKEERKFTQKALEDQAKTSEQQGQEQRFFDLLGLYHSTVASKTLVARMSARSEIPVQYSGKEAIAHFFRSQSTASADMVAFFLELGFFSSKTRNPPMVSFGILDRAPESLKKMDLHHAWNTDETAAIFDHTFRVLFRVLAESENRLGAQHFKYVKLFRAQLSRYELMLIGLNLWLDEEGAKMIPMAEKYGLLKHLPNNNLQIQLQTDLPPAVCGRNFAATALGTAPTGASPC